jgi:hypothetical protein
LQIWISAANPRNCSSSFPGCRLLFRNCCLRCYFNFITIYPRKQVQINRSLVNFLKWKL